MFQFTPKTENELKSMNLIDPGEYQFRVIKAEDTTSKSGNPMIKLTLIIWDAQGRERTVFDYLMTLDSMLYKVKHFCDSTGLEDKYLAGAFSSADCENKGGYLKLVVQADKTGQYPDKNSVADYLVKPKVAESPVVDTFQDDEIPF